MATISDPEYAPPTALPFPAGTSPFRQKGNAYLGDMRYLDATVAGGFAAVLAAVPDPAVRAFFQQKILPSEWYDAYPGSMLESSAARVRGVAFERHRRQTGAWHASDAVRGIYGALLRVISNENVALWGPRISSLYFAFGKVASRVDGPRNVTATHRGVPRELAQWIVYASVGFTEAALLAAGATRARVEIGEVTPDGREYGRDLVRTVYRVAWD